MADVGMAFKRVLIATVLHISLRLLPTPRNNNHATPTLRQTQVGGVEARPDNCYPARALSCLSATDATGSQALLNTCDPTPRGIRSCLAGAEASS